MRPALRRNTMLTLAAAIASVSPLAYAGTSSNNGIDAVTISLSGSTAMRNFTIDAGFTLLQPGTSITIGGRTISATNVGGTSVQLAAQNFGGTLDALPTVGNSLSYTTANLGLLRVEWHEQGSVEGIRELVDGQIDDSRIGNLDYNPTLGNGVYINRNKWGGTSPTGPLSGTINGHTLDLNTAAGSRVAQAQSRVQMAISDVAARQGFSLPGTATFNAAPGSAGYGKGNTRLAAAPNTSGLGIARARQQLDDVDTLNMSTTKIDPGTGTNYTAGPWNTAGIGNLDSKTVAITATTIAANPGTGLEKINRTDAQWLQAAGRLQNGADFNVASRDVNSGTRNVAAVNTGLDPSWAVGENDDGNTGATATANDPQSRIGADIRFSGKTSGGSALRPTIQNSRMGVGTLGLSDVRATTTNSNATPLRALDYRDDANDLADATGDAASNTFVRVSAENIVEGRYVIWQNQTYVTVKDNKAAFAGEDVATWSARTDATTGIKGDTNASANGNGKGDVYNFRENIFTSNANFPPAGVANPTDALLARAFIPPKLMKVQKDADGIRNAVTNPSADLALIGSTGAPANTTFLSSSSYTNNFAVGAPSSITTGPVGTSLYGGASTRAGTIYITESNYLFGDFNLDGSRDFADVIEAQKQQAKLATLGTDWTTNLATKIDTTGLAPAVATALGQAGANASTRTAGLDKGDLIVKGDFNSDGAFDGKDLYILARGASLADSATATGLTAASGATFADRVRNPNAVLRKNAALDALDAAATSAQKLSASANLANDPTGANAFNKFDANRDGLVNRTDASIVDKFVGEDYRVLADVLDATIADNGTINAALPQVPFSLVNAELTDDAVIRANGATSDFGLIRAALGTSKLLDGDANFDGVVNFDDLLVLASNYNASVDRWSKGDFNLDGVVNFDDLLGLAGSYNSSVPGGLGGDWALALASVPEPTSLAAIGFAGAGILSRRRRTK